ncbi:retrovirus-related pol polyprotein from transposon TNT 1-94 [Tanacetum coccineum]
MSKNFESLQKHAINLELDLQHCKEKIKQDKSFKENQSNVFLKEREQYFEIQDLKAQLQDKGIAISELKKLIEKMKGKSVETKFEKSSVIRQPNAFKSQRQSILDHNLRGNDLEDMSHGLTIVKEEARSRNHQPKHDVNKSVATSSKKTVATDSTVKKSRNITRKLYEQVSKTCSWWYPKYTPSGYKWKPKSEKGNVNPNLVEIVLFIVDSGCSKHMTGNLKLLTNFVEKFLGTVKFGNDQIAPILGYGDLVQGTITIKRKNSLTCYIRDLKGNDLLTGSRGTDLYSISLQDSTSPNPICLMAKATSSQAWLWHRRLSHLNFDTINLLSKNNIVNGLPKLKFVKDHLCSSCELGKAKRKSFHTKTTPSSKRRLQLLHMDLCGPMRVESINGKKYVLVIVDDFSRYTWTHFLRSKDETPGVLIDFLTLVQRGLHAQVTTVRTDKGTEFLNKSLHAYFAKEGIRHETSTARTPEQNGVVERRNRTLVEAARAMLSAAKVPLFFWAKAIATTCFTQNRSLVIPRHEKTPYHIINARKPSVKSSYLCYLCLQSSELVFNKRTRIIVETIHVNFDELPQMASDHVSSDPVPQCSTTVLEQDSLSPGPQSQENVPQVAETATTSNELELLYSPMFSELLNGTSHVVSKSSANPPPFEHSFNTIQRPTHVPTVTAPENIIQAETNTENAQFDDDELINIFSTSVQEQGEHRPRHVDISKGRIDSKSHLHCSRLEAVRLFMHGFVDPYHPDKVYPLKKALYGLKQAPRAWYDELSNFLVSNGFSKGSIDPTLNSDPQSLVGNLINQAKYAQEILKKHGMTSCDSIGTPMATKHLDADLSDSDHAGCLDSRKSTSGGIQFLGGDKLVSWSSKKQDCTSMSSAEAEYVSLSACCAQVLWLRTQLTDYGFHFDKIPMYCDSKAAIAISCNPVQHSRTKHIDVRYHFIKEQVEKDRFKSLVRQLGMRCLTPDELEVLAIESA